MSISDKQTEALKAPLDRSHVKKREQGGQQVSYVEGWHVIAEANRIFGFDGWTRETILLTETNRDLVTLRGNRGEYKQWRIGYIAKVRVTALGVVREGTGYGSGMGRPEAIGDAVEGAIKEAETDAMKRALMTFGNPFGLALYDKTQAQVEGTSDHAPAKAIPAAANTAKRLTESESATVHDQIDFELKQARTLDALAAAWKRNWSLIQTLHPDHEKALTAKKEGLKATLSKAA